VTPHKLWVRRYDGAKPNPTVNWAYVEGSFIKTLYLDEPNIVARWGPGWCLISGSDGVTQAGIYVRPASVTVPGARVEKTGSFWFEDPRIYGASGNAIGFYDVVRGGVDLGRSKYVRDDFFNGHSFYSYGNVNTGDRTLEGRHIHLWYWYPYADEHCETGWKDQIALTGSSQVVTSHDQVRMTGCGAFGNNMNGPIIADVSGANTLHVAPFMKGCLLASGGSVPKAGAWCDGTLSGTGTPITKMRILYGGGQISPAGTMFAATVNGELVVGAFKDPITTLKTGGGTIKDGFGTDL
jgi:hypothetical protein